MIAAGALVISGASVAAQGTHRAPDTAVMWFGISIAIVGVVIIFVLVVLAFVRWGEDRTSPLVITHKPEDPDCVQLNNNGLQLRVAVTNSGRVGLREVRLRLTPFKPRKESHFAQLIHDNDFGKSSTGENLAVGDTAHFDVAFISAAREAPFVPPMLFFCYADEALRNLHPEPPSAQLRTFELRLSATGWHDTRDVEPKVRDYVLCWRPNEAATLEDPT